MRPSRFGTTIRILAAGIMSLSSTACNMPESQVDPTKPISPDQKPTSQFVVSNACLPTDPTDLLACFEEQYPDSTTTQPVQLANGETFYIKNYGNSRDFAIDPAMFSKVVELAENLDINTDIIAPQEFFQNQLYDTQNFQDRKPIDSGSTLAIIDNSNVDCAGHGYAWTASPTKDAGTNAAVSVLPVGDIPSNVGTAPSTLLSIIGVELIHQTQYANATPCVAESVGTGFSYGLGVVQQNLEGLLPGITNTNDLYQYYRDQVAGGFDHPICGYVPAAPLTFEYFSVISDHITSPVIGESQPTSP